MNTKLFSGDATAFETPMLAVFVVDLATDNGAEPSLALLSGAGGVQDAAQALLASGEFKAALGETALLHAPSGIEAERLLLVGLGKAKDFSLDRVRKAAGTAVRAAKPLSVRSLAIAFLDTDGQIEKFPAALT